MDSPERFIFNKNLLTVWVKTHFTSNIFVRHVSYKYLEKKVKSNVSFGLNHTIIF
jgi:hypothetical protein